MIKRYRARIGLREGRALLLAACLAAPLGGCSFSLPSLRTEAPETTGSLRAAAPSPLAPELGQEDWRRARGAMAVALDPQGAGAAVSWDNPDSGLKGVFTPVGRPFVRDAEVCRAFLATVTLPERTVSLQGSACRDLEDWEIKEVSPWRKPA